MKEAKILLVQFSKMIAWIAISSTKIWQTNDISWLDALSQDVRISLTSLERKFYTSTWLYVAEIIEDE